MEITVTIDQDPNSEKETRTDIGLVKEENLKTEDEGLVEAKVVVKVEKDMKAIKEHNINILSENNTIELTIREETNIWKTLTGLMWRTLKKPNLF